jgi:hypothetical protein
MASGYIAPTSLTSTLNGGEQLASRSGLLTSGERSPIPTEQEAESEPEPQWTPWGRQKFLAPIGNSIPAVRDVARRYTL